MVGLFFVDNTGEDWIEDMKEIICNNEKTKIVSPCFTSGGIKSLKEKTKHFLSLENNLKSVDFSPYLPELGTNVTLSQQ